MHIDPGIISVYMKITWLPSQNIQVLSERTPVFVKFSVGGKQAPSATFVVFRFRKVCWFKFADIRSSAFTVQYCPSTNPNFIPLLTSYHHHFRILPYLWQYPYSSVCLYFSPIFSFIESLLQHSINIVLRPSNLRTILLLPFPPLSITRPLLIHFNLSQPPHVSPATTSLIYHLSHSPTPHTHRRNYYLSNWLFSASHRSLYSHFLSTITPTSTPTLPLSPLHFHPTHNPPHKSLS